METTKMTSSKLEQIIASLQDKGLSYALEEGTSATRLYWKTKKSSYSISFDSEGEPLEADIDGLYRMFPGYVGLTQPRRVWMYESEGYSGASRFHTFEKWLGIRLFKD